MKFTTLAVLIQAIQLTLDNGAEVQEFLGTNGDVREFGELEVAAVIDNPRGILVAKPTDYIIRASETDVYPMPEHEFINKYQPAGDVVDTGAALTEALEQVKAATKRAEDAEKLAEALKKQLAAKPAPAVNATPDKQA